jgi:hypothetical protein
MWDNNDSETMHNFIHWTGSEICPWAGYVFWRNMLHGLQYTSAVKGYFHPLKRIATLVGDVQLCLGVSRVLHKTVIVMYQQVRVHLQNCKTSHQIGK